MDGLDEFEKQLAADRAERDKEKSREHRHRKQRHDRDRDQDRDRDDQHHHRRSRRDDDRESRHRKRRHSDQNHNDSHRHKESRRRNDDGHRSHDASDKTASPSEGNQRDAWMTAPSALQVEHIHRKQPRPKSPPPEPAKRVVSAREINSHIRGDAPELPAAAQTERSGSSQVDYTFGDAGSSWRMTKLRTVYDRAKESGRSVEDIALERFGTLQDFDNAREEKEELDKRKLYGAGYEMKEKPTGELFQQRQPAEQEPSVSVGPAAQESLQAMPQALDQTSLNRLRAQMMKAKLRRAPNAAQLEEEYNRASAAATSQASANQSVVLGVMESRQLAGTRGEVKTVDTKRGRERGTVVENEDMTIDDMLREERRTKGQAGGEGMRLAERIAKDGKYDAGLDYMDENAEKLAKRVHKSEINLKNMAVSQFQKMNKMLESCPLCHHEDTGQPPLAPVLALGTRTFLTLATEPEISPGGAVIVPMAHRSNLLECDDDEWEEIRNFMKSLTRMYHEQGREVLFYENAAAPHRHLHAAMVAVPIPYEEGATAPAYFKEAFLSADEEWAQHRKIIDTDKASREGAGRMAFRRSIAKEMPYFHVWFTLDGGLGHIIEDQARWPKGDIFAREVIGGIVDAEVHLIKKQGRWTKGDPRVEGWKRGWRKFDWTRMLAE